VIKTKQLKSYQYAQDVLSGKQLASSYIKLAAERFMHDLERNDLVFDLKRIELINTIFEKVIYIPELNKPNVVFPPHAFWLHQLYGFKYAETGIRK
jgi:phage terminase large subunit-like protein